MTDFKDVYIIPQYSEITSRTQVNTSLIFKKSLINEEHDIKIDVPVMSANMDTVTDGTMALAIGRAGGLGGVHRFMSIEDNIKEFNFVKNKQLAFMSVGVNSESRDRVKALYEAGARFFIIDIAHGHSLMMKEMIKFMRDNFGIYVYIMAGNVATPNACSDLISWGADAIKIGIGPGAVCSTKNVTGVTVPQFTAVQNVCAPENRAKYSKRYMEVAKEGKNNLFNKPILVADGGIQEIGDIAKALGAGADLVMCGRLFAGCRETPGPRINGKKVYRGMASKDAMLTIKDASLLPTPEGISTVLETADEAVEEVIKNIKGGLQSAFSYSNANNLEEFQRKCLFGYRNK